MTRAAHLPLTPSALPRQRLAHVVDLQAPPKHDMTCLGTVEWAWHTLSSRIEIHHLHRERRHWIVSMRDPAPTQPGHAWMVAANGQRAGVSAVPAATHLIAARWREEAQERALDGCHFIAGKGAPRVPDGRAIAWTVRAEAACSRPRQNKEQNDG